MTSHTEAIDIINKYVSNGKETNLNLNNALNHILSKDIYSPIYFPPFAQSAMDGYAISHISESLIYSIAGEVAAGDNAEDIQIGERDAVRIFTGAMLPSNTIAVIKQEDVELVDVKTIAINKVVKAEENIRPIGEQTKTGELILSKGTKLTPGSIGYLAMLGISTVSVYKKPTIIIIATGSELLPQGEKLTPGKIYESNTYTLKAALQSQGFKADVKIVKDDPESTNTIAKEAIEKYDFIIFTGGISVGDYDFVHDVLVECGVQELFYKVKQKPGKPLYFGMKDNKIIFALPGNPAAVLTSFYIYVLEALGKYLGDDKLKLSHSHRVIDDNYVKSKNLTYFLKGKKSKTEVSILKDQSSAMLSSFVHADCLIILPEGVEKIEKGEKVEIISLQ